VKRDLLLLLKLDPLPKEEGQEVNATTQNENNQ